ncbi:MAG: S8/S53 family peptidase [Rhodobiaceae bacterium]|jgi:hypothetical protein|nr:S8/S53 family peptidase [Rhodobiaceae bacterium]
MSENRIVVLGAREQPLSAIVEFYFGDRVYHDFLQTDQDGFVFLPELDGMLPSKATVIPIDGHWAVSKQLATNRKLTPIHCPPIATSNGQSWWLGFLGVLAKLRVEKTIRIGVIDAGFDIGVAPSGIRMVNLDGYYPEHKEPSTFHGLHVAKVIHEIVCQNNNVEIFVLDAADGSGLRLDGEAVCAGISSLVDDYAVDVLNLSNGLFFDPTRDDHVRIRERLIEEIDYATACGCAVIAAGGNEDLEGLAIPARFESVIGVGSIGVADVAPHGTDCRQTQDWSMSIEERVGQLGDDCKVFHHLGTCYGEGLDLVATGLGIDVRYPDGSVFVMDGTSFAAPIVTAVLSVVLKQHALENAEFSSNRAVLAAKELLTSMCQNTGLPQQFQGLGVLRALK